MMKMSGRRGLVVAASRTSMSEDQCRLVFHQGVPGTPHLTRCSGDTWRRHHLVRTGPGTPYLTRRPSLAAGFLPFRNSWSGDTILGTGTPYLTRLPSLAAGFLPFRNSGGRRSGATIGLGAGFLPFENSAQVFFERRQKRLVAQWAAGTLVGAHDLDVLFANHPVQGSDASSGPVRARERPSPVCRPVRARGPAALLHR